MSHTTPFAPISSLTPLCLTSSFCVPPIQASSGPAQFWFPWQEQRVICINLVAGFTFLLLFLPQDGQTLPVEGKGILVRQVLVHNNCADTTTCPSEDIMGRQLRV